MKRLILSMSVFCCMASTLHAGQSIVLETEGYACMGGAEAAQHILKIDPHARLIVSSGYSTDPVMAEYKSFGFCATLQKPYTLDEISKILRSVLSPI